MASLPPPPPRRSLSPRRGGNDYSNGPPHHRQQHFDGPPPPRGERDYRDRDDRGPPPRGGGGRDNRDRRGPMYDDRRVMGPPGGRGFDESPRGGGWDERRGPPGPPPPGGGRGGYDRRSRSPEDRRGGKRRRSSLSPPPGGRRNSFRGDGPRGPPRGDYPPPREERDFAGPRFAPIAREGPPPPPDVLDPPEMLDYQVTFRYFTDFHTRNNPSLASDSAALEASWQQYLIDFKRRGVVGFFEEMKEQSWFKEKYEPSKEMTGLRDRLKKKGREGGMQRFLDELEAGNLEAISYDYPEGRKFSAEAPTAADGDVKMEDGEAAAAATGDGAANGSPKLSRTSNPDLVTIEPNDRQLFIKTITPDVSREELEAHCSRVSGFDYLALSEPIQNKRWHRVGWVAFKSANDIPAAMSVLCESTLADFTLHMSPLDKLFTVRIKAAPGIMNTSERLRKDLEQIRFVAAGFEKDEGDSRGSVVIEERFARGVDEVERIREEGGEDVERRIEEREEELTKKTLDLYLHYLRSVFHTCYYCLATFHFAEELERKCPTHLRREAKADVVNSRAPELAWLRSFEERLPLLTSRESLDPREFGGDSYEEELHRLCPAHMKEEEEGKFRCKECNKLFSALKFIEKHIATKHYAKLGPTLDKLKYLNNYVLDPSHLPLSDRLDNFTASSLREQHALNSSTPAGAHSALASRSLADRIGDRLPDDAHLQRGGSVKRRTRTQDEAMMRTGPPPPPPEGALLDPRAARGASSYADLDNAPSGATDIVLQY